MTFADTSRFWPDGRCPTCGITAVQDALPPGCITISDYIAEQEKIPERKAALDRARAELATPPAPTGWIITHEPSGRVLHFSTRDGWSLEVVTENP